MAQLIGSMAAPETTLTAGAIQATGAAHTMDACRQPAWYAAIYTPQSQKKLI
jgi:hypothetical protein